MKKADLEQHHANYVALVGKAKHAESCGLIREALTASLDAFEFMDGMIQYERKYLESDDVAIEAIDCAMRYAPILLDFRSIDKLEALLHDFKRISKNAAVDPMARVTSARDALQINHRLWSCLERNTDVRLDDLSAQISSTDAHVREVADLWARMGLITISKQGGGSRIRFATRMGEIVGAKCSLCGQLAEAPKAMFIEPVSCSSCNTRNQFVFVAN